MHVNANLKNRPRFLSSVSSQSVPVRLVSWLPIIALILLTICAYFRNAAYADHIALWSDTMTKSALKQRPHLNLGQALSESDRSSEAIHEFHCVLALKEDGSVRKDEVCRELGVVYSKNHDDDMAINIWSKGLAIYPHDPDPRILNNLAFAYFMKGEYKEAQSYAERTLAAAPKKWSALNILGEIYLARRDYGKALRYFLEAVEQNEDASIMLWQDIFASDEADKYAVLFEYGEGYLSAHDSELYRQNAQAYLKLLKESVRPHGESEALAKLRL